MTIEGIGIQPEPSWGGAAGGGAGEPGADGSQILTGSGAPSDGTGANGDFYLRTSNGDYYKKAAGTWGSPLGNLTGPRGDPGSAGALIYTGSAAPDDVDGASGDVYIRTSNGDYYQKTPNEGGTAWNSPIGNLTGPQGEPGSAGTLPFSVPTPTSGSGTEGSPYTHADGTAGIQTALDALAAGRGGTLQLEAARYDITANAGLTVLGPGIRVDGGTAGFNIDPNGTAEGITGNKLRFTGTDAGLLIGQSGSKHGGVHIERVYLWAPTAQLLAAINIIGPLDQAWIEHVTVGGKWAVGLQITEVADALHVHGFCMNGGPPNVSGYSGQQVGIYQSDGVVAKYSNFTNIYIADIDAEGFMQGNTTDTGIRLDGSFFVRCSRKSSYAINDACAVWWASSFGTISNTVFDATGKTVGGTVVAGIPGLIVAGNKNIVTGCTFINNSGYGVVVKGNGNVIGPCTYGSNNGAGTGKDILIDSGATDTLVIRTKGSALPGIVDNGTNTTYAAA